jgi:hypothetical protein
MAVNEIGKNTLRVATSIHFAASTLQKLSSTVYLFDSNWRASNIPDDQDTLPFAYLEVIKENITQEIEVSKKRIILFEPGKTTSSLGATNASGDVRPSVLNVVADNVVNQPVVHKLEVLVPANKISGVLDDIGNTVSTATQYLYEMTGNDVLSGLASALAIVNATRELTERVLALVRTFAGKNNDFNRRSLLAMSRRRSLLQYKPWNSWELRYVVISGLDMSKIGTEDDYYRASIELTEIPILYVGDVKGSFKRVDAQSSAITKAVITVFKAATGMFTR